MHYPKQPGKLHSRRNLAKQKFQKGHSSRQFKYFLRFWVNLEILKTTVGMEELCQAPEFLLDLLPGAVLDNLYPTQPVCETLHRA
jgi:hypothetical protein